MEAFTFLLAVKYTDKVFSLTTGIKKLRASRNITILLSNIQMKWIEYADILAEKIS